MLASFEEPQSYLSKRALDPSSLTSRNSSTRTSANTVGMSGLRSALKNTGKYDTAQNIRGHFRQPGAQLQKLDRASLAFREFSEPN